MIVSFLGQPFREWEQIGGLLSEALRKKSNTRMWAITAWGKRSGLTRLSGALDELRAHGGTSELIVGIDEGGATVEGLELAMDIFDMPFVFHDPGPRTFHPKLYVVEGADRATAIVGSGNLTKGGLYANYEGALALRLDLRQAEDAALLADMRAYFEKLRSLTRACRPLTKRLLGEIVADPAIVVRSEGEHSERKRKRSRSGQSPFGDPVRGLHGAPKTPVHANGDSDDVIAPNLAAAPQASGAASAANGATSPSEATGGIKAFFKMLSLNDVSKNSPGQMIIPIEFLSFFGRLELQKDDSASGGSGQLHRMMAVRFRDGRYTRQAPEARAILYKPAANHPRQNTDLRFTFKDTKISSRLKIDDVLVFTREESGEIVVERRPSQWRPPHWAGRRRYGAF